MDNSYFNYCYNTYNPLVKNILKKKSNVFRIKGCKNCKLFSVNIVR